jgi:uncharacterized protein YjbI with pentapeptide repeats
MSSNFGQSHLLANGHYRIRYRLGGILYWVVANRTSTQTGEIGADLTSANLGWAILYRTDLRGGDLRGVILEGADLTRAALYNVNLSGAKLYRAKLSRAEYDELTEWPGDFDPEESGAIPSDLYGNPVNFSDEEE